MGTLSRKQYREPTPEEQKALELLELPKVGCRCGACRKLCSDGVPGTPTLEEAKVLLGMGLGDKMMLRGCNVPDPKPMPEGWVPEFDGDWWGGAKDTREVEALMPALVGSEGQHVPWWPRGKCSMLNYGGMCSIHKVKPLECAAVTGCDKSALFTDEGREAYERWREKRIFATWDTDEGRQVVEDWKQAVGYYGE